MPVVRNLKSHTSGDWYDGAIFTLNITPAIDLTTEGTVAELWLRLNSKDNSEVALRLSTRTGGLTILNATQVQINGQVIGVPPGKYVYDLQTMIPPSKTKTYVEGTWVILKDVTRWKP